MKSSTGPAARIRYSAEDEAPWDRVKEQLNSAAQPFCVILREDEVLPDAVLAAAAAALKKAGDGQKVFVFESVPVRMAAQIGQRKNLRHTAVKEVCLDEPKECLAFPGCINAMLVRTDMLRSEQIDGTYGAGWLEELSCRILLNQSTCLYGEGFYFGSASALLPQGGYAKELSEEDWYYSMVRDFVWRSLCAWEEKEGTCPVFLQAQAAFVLQVLFWKNRSNQDRHALGPGKALDGFLQICGNILGKVDRTLFLEQEGLHVQRRFPVLEQAVLADLQATVPVGFSSQAGRGASVLADSSAYKSREESESAIFTEQEGSPKRVPADLWGFPVILRLTELKEDGLHMVLEAPSCLRSCLRVVTVPGNGPDEEVSCEPEGCYSGAAYFGKEFPLYLFRICLPVSGWAGGRILRFYAGQTLLPAVSSGYVSRISSMVRGSYWRFRAGKKSWMIRFERSDMQQKNRITGIRIFPSGIPSAIWQEMKVLTQMPFGENRSRRMFVTRLQYWMAWPAWHRKRIWLTFDKLYKGGDCGEAFYRYAMERAQKAAEPSSADGPQPVYVIRKDAADRKRLLDAGYHPVTYGTKQQRLSYLYAQIVFGTHSNVPGFNGFNSWEIQFVQDRLKAVNVCIQHGLSIQDLRFDSSVLENNNRRYYCASPFEIRNLSDPAYGYRPDVLRLTGIPRFDDLISREDKIILITPTWRSWLAMPAVLGKSRPYNPGFKDSDYYRIYQDLICDERLLAAAERLGYRIVFLLHPVLSAQLDDFNAPAGVEICASVKTGYGELLSRASLMVTDYSGVQFDFAYMGKPVLYYHPAALPPNYEADSFDYAAQGFGPVCTGQTELVTFLCSAMEQGCRPDPFWRARRDAFFAFRDRENCRRIYEDALLI